MNSRTGRLAIGTAGAALMVALIYTAMQTSQAQGLDSFFPPRKRVVGNSLYERLVAKGTASPIIMAGVNDHLAPQFPETDTFAGTTKHKPAFTAPPPQSVQQAAVPEPAAPVRERRPATQPRRGLSLLRPGATERSASPGVDLTAGHLPDLDLGQQRVDTGAIDVEGIEVAFAASLPESSTADDITFLLLHGANFNSETWEQTKTLQTLAALGYNAVAIDLPGAGFQESTTRGRLPSGLTKPGFLETVRYELGLGSRVILVSPSLSGEFSLPLLQLQPDWLIGFVAVAPVGTEDLTVSKARRIRIPTAIIYGSKDLSLGERSRQALAQIRTSVTAVIPGAGHAAYRDNPQLWHLMLHNFARNLAAVAAIK